LVGKGSRAKALGIEPEAPEYRQRTPDDERPANGISTASSWLGPPRPLSPIATASTARAVHAEQAGARSVRRR
jgi:hypothetical protein